MILKNDKLYTSYSQLERYLKCPYSWKLRYIDGIKEEIKNKHLDYGNIIHSTFEFIFSYYLNLGELPPRLVAYKEFEDNMKKYDLKCDNEIEFNEWFDLGYGAIEDIYDKRGIYKQILDPETEIVGVELPFELPISIPEREFVTEDGEIVVKDEVYIVGYIDLLVKTPEGYIMIDHKSGGKKFDKKKLRNDLQFPVYALAVKEMFDEYPIKGYYNFTKLGVQQEVLFSNRVTEEMNESMDKRSPDKIYFKDPKSSLKEIRLILKHMYEKKYEPKTSYLCNWCDFRDICPAVNHTIGDE